MKTKARVIAFYLPQYHPIPENDAWWGKGFTEWTNVGKAKPLFKGHYQPRVPADLGYYDLRVPETRKAQADMAREHGIEGFCYWHYWFGNGKRLIERPFNEVVASGEPDFPFCLAWANETWKGFAHGLKNRNVLIEQLYPGVDDYTAHFYEMLPSFKDKRYMQIDGRLIFMIYKPLATPEIKIFIDTWRELAMRNGLAGFFFIGHSSESTFLSQQILEVGFDAVNTVRLTNYAVNYQKRNLFIKIRDRIIKMIHKLPRVVDYEDVSKYFLDDVEDALPNVYPSIIPGWDHSPRSNNEALILINSTPKTFENHVKHALKVVKNKEHQHKIIFLKSWNEWAEGNYMEPDLKYGKSFLEVLKYKLTYN